AGQYAVGYFEAWSIDSLAGVIDAAEQGRAPVIIGFNGEFHTHSGRLLPDRVAWLAALGRAAADSCAVPCGLIFNECTSHEAVREAILQGFTLVMPIPAEGESAAAYAARTRELAALAHARGAAIEAELGTLPSGADPAHAHAHADAHAHGQPTDPAAAAAFIRETGADLLAVSAGNVHILLEGRRGLDLPLIAAVRAAAGVPLVLHGGTGIDDDALRAAIPLGVAKVNYGTGLKQAWLRAVRAALATDEPDPHRLLGMGGPEDALVAGRIAVRDAVLARMDPLGCLGRAG
ncbi:MAG: class II fructose-bisphosphate aldolase, partial [Thermomicrobiales bacterium]